MEVSNGDLTKVKLLKWPEDATSIAQLDIIEMQCWIAGQDPRALIYLAQNPKYIRFMRIHYLWPLQLKRFIYKVKRFFHV